MITLAVDCMGGDHGPRVTLAACRQFLDNHPDAHLLLVGLKDSLQSFSHERATVVLATEVVAMDDPVEIERIYKGSVDIVVDGGTFMPEPSSVVSLIDGSTEILRQGKGDLSFLSD